MSGQIKESIQKIINIRKKQNPVMEFTTRSILNLHGFTIDKFNESSIDDPEQLVQLKKIADEWGIVI